MTKLLAIIFSVIFSGVLLVYIFFNIQFERNCKGYLKRAADANTIDLAKVELGRAIGYIEAHNLTSGFTSVIYNTPDEDIGFWYQNLKASAQELASVSAEATSLEKSNVLMKLRETLLDKSDSGEKVTVPGGISAFPYNAIMFWLFFLSSFWATFFWVRYLLWPK